MEGPIDATVANEIVAIARRAGDAIMAVANRRPEWKDDGSPVTEADLAADRVISEGLATLCPNVPILSEETVATVSKTERLAWSEYFLVDPLDGTKEFVRGGTDFTVNIALIRNGQPAWGVVVVPATGDAYVGDVEDGTCTRIDANGAASEIAVAKTARHTPHVVASKSHNNPETDAYLQALGAHEAVRAGSSLKLCRVAEGSADLYPRLGPTMEWDTGAGHAVVLAAGGAVVQPNGEPLMYNKDNLLNPFFLAAANPSAWPSLEVAL